VTRAAGVFILFAVLGLGLAAPTLRWPMVFDDLHLIRTFTGAELLATWTGHWDPDRVETPAYRPLSPAFNHLRAAVFGESVIGHRVFLVLLFAFVLALLVPLAAGLGLPWWTALLAGALMFTTRYSAYHYAWITDGNHLLQGLFVLAAALLLLDGRRRAAAAPRVGALLALALGLLVREDTFAAVPALVLVAAWDASTRDARRRVAAWSAAALGLGVALFVVRRLAVPEAQGLRLDVMGFARAVVRVANPVGWESFDAPTRVLAPLGALVLVATLAGVLAARTRRESRLALVWLASAMAACAPAFVLQRDDLFFFPSLFVALFFATAWTAIALAWPRARPAVGVALAWALLGGAWTSRAQAENFHPLSARAIGWDTEMLYGEYAKVHIPEERRAVVATRLAGLGIRPGERPRQRVRALVVEARDSGRRRPSPDGAVFFPRLPERYF
jgi:hypothetical protein